MTQTCPACGNAQLIKKYDVRDFNQGVPGAWAIIECTRCELGILDPFPKPDEIASFYRDHFYTEEGRRFRGWMEDLRLHLTALRGRHINRLRPNRGRLLDFGAGAGHFVRAMQKYGWQAEGVDPYSNAADRTKVLFDADGRFTLQYPDESFDVITLWYVIEHVSDPFAAMEEFRRVLKPGGLLVLGQQDYASMQRKVFGECWLYLDPPRHLWQFSPKNLGDAARKRGYMPVFTSWATLEMGPYCILQSMLNKIVGNNNDLFRFLKAGALPQSLGGKRDSGPRLWATLISIALLPVLGPLSLILYFVGLAFKQGDIFNLYLRRD